MATRSEVMDFVKQELGDCEKYFTNRDRYSYLERYAAAQRHDKWLYILKVLREHHLMTGRPEKAGGEGTE